MPINPNIALGLQPIQQPNMLGQVGQSMALKAAQQETEGYEGVKSALSGGMSATDPRILQYGKRGIEAFRAAGEGRVKQIEVAKKQNEVLGSIFGGVLQDPTTGPQAVSRLVEMGVMSNEQAQRVIEQAGNNPDAWRKLAKPYYEGAIDAEKRLTAETSIKTANIGAAAPMMNAQLAREKYDDELKYGGPVVTTTIPDPERPGQRIEIQTRRPVRGNQLIPLEVQPMPMRVDISPGSATSAFQPLAGGGGGGVNALAPQGGAAPAPAPNVNALNPNAPQGPTFARPKEAFTAPVPVIDKSGNTVLMQGREAVATGATPATPATEARQIALRKLPDAIAQSKDALNLIDKMVGKEDGSTKPAPGFKGAVGTGIGLRFVPGTSESDFQAMYDQISGGAFLQAFNTLKGGGAITEKEGEKATAAITRMKLSTSEKAFMEAAREFQTVLRRGVATAQKELNAGAGGGGAVSPASTGDIATDPAIQSLLNKYK